MNILPGMTMGMHIIEFGNPKSPKKIKMFMWLVEKKYILTKDNMVKRKWKGNPGCYFSTCPETTDHILFECLIAKVVWGVIVICFNQKVRHGSYEKNGNGSQMPSLG
jgi:hypothetical protein